MKTEAIDTVLLISNGDKSQHDFAGGKGKEKKGGKGKEKDETPVSKFEG